MGYQNEKASVNQYTELYNYCHDKVINKIQGVFSIYKKQNLDFLKKQLPFVYVSKVDDETTPLVSFDGGIATLFPSELAETKIIKVASASPPKWEETFKDYQDSCLFHVFVGLLKWPKGADLTEETIILQTIEDSLKVTQLVELLDHIGVSLESYQEAMFDHLKYKRGSQVEDCFREILEWALMINFNERQKKNKNVDFKRTLPYLIVKDGSLYPHSKTVSDVIAKGIKNYLDVKQFPIVGMVKASRFVAHDSVYRKAINQYLTAMNNNTFFKIPKELEEKMDAKEISYERFFFSIFGGQSIYEVQIPIKHIEKDPKIMTDIMDILNSEVTFSYGGSISTNSYAHVEASLAEREASDLTETLRNEISDIIKDSQDEK